MELKNDFICSKQIYIEEEGSSYSAINGCDVVFHTACPGIICHWLTDKQTIIPNCLWYVLLTESPEIEG